MTTATGKMNELDLFWEVEKATMRRRGWQAIVKHAARKRRHFARQR
eukprot:CAMPEP_0184557546 /NCGR_PEP_ID=MMETSP0199_2-20130426/43021_1 /TAXON_ID=1112570 /ORGANISM="Thraustochytrium sp., Strain LLF1b" /LENGTH=45 /DNA_ID= /DNA_START= /DNA_END= /DNA_ORIENTATION=